MLLVDEARKLRGDAHQYEGEFKKYTFLTIYKEAVWACDLRTKALRCLRTLVKEAMQLSAETREGEPNSLVGDTGLKLPRR
jgi:hypothetical protein